jgi:hypothetical protein
MQSKKRSFKEALTNVLIGFIISLAAGFFIFSLCGVSMKPIQNINTTIGFTLVSILRQYIIRRWFNKGDHHHGVSTK